MSYCFYLVMDFSIYLDGNGFLAAEEIKDERSNRMLTPKFPSVQFTAPNSVP
jgi:hypothetical protein